MAAERDHAAFVRLGPDHAATRTFRAYLARVLGGERHEQLFSSALQLDRAVVSGSSLFAGALIPNCTWDAGDLDIWAASPVETLIEELEGQDVGVPVRSIFHQPENPIRIGERIGYRGAATLGKWRYFSITAISGDNIRLRENVSDRHVNF